MRSIRLVCAALVFGASWSANAAEPPRKDREFAIELFQESKRRYRDGEFEAAAKLLEEAYAIDPAPTLLYNLARARESAGNLEGAVDAYRRYLDADPAAKDRGAIEKRIENLDRQIREREALRAQVDAKKAPPPAPPPTVTTAPPEPEVSPLPWIVAGVGAAVIGSGVVLGILASGKNDDAMGAASQVDAQNLADEAGGLASAANASYIAGGIVVGAGLVWGIVAATQSPDEGDVALLPVLGPNGGGLIVRY